MTTMILGAIAPSALPALRIAGAVFLIINLLGGVWMWRQRGQLFGSDPSIEGDRVAFRQLQVVALVIPWLSLTFRLASEWVGLWR